MNLKFHWRLLQGGETDGDTRAAAAELTRTGLPDPVAQVEFCRIAEGCGIQGLLLDVGSTKPDPIVLAGALGRETTRIEFIVAYRSGMIPPTTFVQQLNTLSSLVGGRLSLNIVAGHSPAEQRFYGDFLEHDERYRRTEEFLAICQALWQRNGPVDFDGQYYRVQQAWLNTPFVAQHRSFPEIFIAGSSLAARDAATRQGTLWMRLADKPGKLSATSKPVLAAGKELGLRMAIVARPSREQARQAAAEIVARMDPQHRNVRKEAAFVGDSDSDSMRRMNSMADVEWLTPWLWTGAVRSHGAAAICMVGSYDELAAAFLEYKRIGVRQFILSGWPKLSEMMCFGEHVLPRVRRLEEQA